MALKVWIRAAVWSVSLAISGVVAVVGYGYYRIQQALASPVAISLAQEVKVQPGDTSYVLLAQWERQGWIDSAFWGRLGLRMEPKLTQLKTGTYALEPTMSLRQALAHLASGEEIQFQITLVEGGTVAEWLSQIQAHPRIRATLDDVAALAEALGTEQENPEGWLFPDTYAFTDGTEDRAVLLRAYRRMTRELEKAWAARQPDLPLATPYELLILASIVEKETGAPGERSLVSSVFVNRLNKGMRLQTDPTVIYGAHDYQGRITRKHLDTWTPYNTYRINGLTPTPIANPSLASLQAAAQPAQSDYLYFVSKGDGSHQFSRTLREHNNAVNRYIRNRK
ncbi:endolytic transglycosylase MltG [Ferrimonas gelatinilytica]|uniref:Endolytic murein transglycosylase n=1 Tax=Ferrimonas gelatinilytica TaxID=1255257 RepID=A0ABP9RV61_9GAMM